MILPAEAGREDVVARIRAHPVEGDAGEMRAAFRRLVLGDAPPDGMPPGVRIEWQDGAAVLTPERPDAARRPPILWFHGGGYVFGSPETHLRPAAWLAHHAGRRAILPAYRLAPEHPWPAQIEDALAACERFEAPVLAGDSAGGHLALVAALARARRGRPASALLLFSPNTDRTGLNTSRAEMSEADPMVSDEDDRRLARMCFRDMDPADPQVSPLLDDLTLLPPTHAEAGRPEVLLDDSRLLEGRARDAGADFRLHVAPGLVHMGQLWAPFWSEADASLRRAADFLAERLPGVAAA